MKMERTKIVDREEMIKTLEHCMLDSREGCEECPRAYKDGRVACEDYTKKVIQDLNIAKCFLISSQPLTREMNIRIGQAISAAIDLLKEQKAGIEKLEYDLAMAQSNLNYYLNGND